MHNYNILLNINSDMIIISNVVLDFWKNREKQFVVFYEQINDKQIGEYLIITKSPCMNIYREIIEIAVTGKSFLLVTTIFFFYLSYNSDNYNFFLSSKKRNKSHQYVLSDINQEYKYD